MGAAPVLIWHRNDLRLRDNPAVTGARSTGAPVLGLYIFDEAAEGAWPLGGASRWWLHHSLRSLQADYREVGAELLIFAGVTAELLPKLVRTLGAREIFVGRRGEPAGRLTDAAMVRLLVDQGVTWHVTGAHLLSDPDAVRNLSGKPFQVFTPYFKKLRATADFSTEDRLGPRASFNGGPASASASVKKIAGYVADVQILGLSPKIPWDREFTASWTPGEEGARIRLKKFVADIAGDYGDGRDRPGADGTSMLSPHLHFGELSPLRVWDAVTERLAVTRTPKARESMEIYLKELGWREFAYHLLHHFPSTPEQPLRSEFAKFPWQKIRPAAWKAWTQGQTGFPIVDAGMRQLWRTGWMHNRVRMIAASFLVKDLRYPWTEGARWFWDTLVDADLASNTLGWQWTAGCGADAAPYFRVFNPTLQGERFDPEGDYVRKWIPELAKVPARWIHRPELAPPEVLRSAGVKLGVDYPTPLVDHAAERDAALEAFRTLKGKV